MQPSVSLNCAGANIKSRARALGQRWSLRAIQWSGNFSRSEWRRVTVQLLFRKRALPDDCEDYTVRFFYLARLIIPSVSTT